MMEVNQKKDRSKKKWIECCVKGASAGMKEILLDLVPGHEIFTNISNELKENYFQGRSLGEISLEECEKYLSEGDEAYQFFLASVVEFCISKMEWKEFYTKNLEEISVEYSREYVEKYSKILSDVENGLVKNHLPKVLERAIEAMRLECEDHPEFQVEIKKETVAELSDHGTRITTLEERVGNMEGEERSECNGRMLGSTRMFRNLWTEELFLDPDLTLEKIYQVPTCDRRKQNVYEVLCSTLKRADDPKNRALLILGHPGYGKTASIVYLLNHLPKEEKRNIRTKCFRDFKGENLAEDTIQTVFEEMLVKLGAEDFSSLSNTILILDGLDEINLNGREKELVDKFYKLSKDRDIENFNLLITCRTNRFMGDEKKCLTEKDMPHLEIDPFSSKQMEDFVSAFLEKKTDSSEYRKVAENILGATRLCEGEEKENAVGTILQIPLILYMVLSSKIMVTEGCKVVDIYDQLFSVTDENSLYRKAKYYEESQHHRITEIDARKIHEFSKRIAMKMWETDSAQATISMEDYEKIGQKYFEGKVESLPIGQYLVYFEGKRSYEVYFVHRSMYEYFVALSIFDAIKALDQSEKTVEELFEEWKVEPAIREKTILFLFAEFLGYEYLGMTPEIQEYLLYMISKYSLQKKEDWWRSVFDLFLEKGFSRFVDGYEVPNFICIRREQNRFYNLIWVIRELLRKLDPTREYYEIVSKRIEFAYLLSTMQCARVDLSNLDLSGMLLGHGYFREADLRKTNLKGVYLSEADLTGADLTGTKLDGSILYGADLNKGNFTGTSFENVNMNMVSLRGANLRKANLSKVGLGEADLTAANLSKADLSGANLGISNLRRANLSEADLTGANLGGANLTDADLYKAKLEDANLYNTNLNGAIVTGVKRHDEEFLKALYGTSKQG